MQAEIICIGDELLIGQTVDTNSAWLGERLNREGIRVFRSTKIGDNREDILRAFAEAVSRSELVIISGGLGPTKDDITKSALCEFFNTRLVLNEEALQRVKEVFSFRNLVMPEINVEQAMLPESCTVIPNARGTASGMWFEKENSVVISIPGVPYEMEHLMENILLDKIRNHYQLPSIIHRSISTIGIGESALAERIEDWESSLQEHSISLAYLPSPGMVKLRMSAYDVADKLAMQKIFAQKESELLAIIPENVFGYDDDSLQEVVGRLLRDSGATLTVAESCTGGNIARLITSVSGASEYFPGSFVTYSEEQKTALIGVKQSLIEKCGVVSAEVAEAMATGARERMNVIWALSTTGVAGPAGGTDKNPVGTVWIGLAGPTGVKSFHFSFGRKREINIALASNAALNLLRKEILSR